MTHLEETLKKAEKYFNRRSIADEKLTPIIPELLNVIKELYTLRESSDKTRDYIESWRKTKLQLTVLLRLSNGNVVEVDNPNIDTREHDMYIEWLFGYLNNLYVNKVGKTIGYAHALLILTQIHNCMDGFKVEYDLPNSDENDVLEVIESESNSVISINNNKKLSDKPIKRNSFIDYIHHHNKPALMEKLHELLDITKGKIVAITITALIELHILAGYQSNAVLYDSMRKEFGEIGSNSGLNNFLNKNNKILNDQDIKPVMEILKAI